MIYFASFGESGPIKIGMSGRPSRRVAGMSTGSPEEIVLLGVMPGGLDVEASLHERFANTRIRGEWFERSPELLAFIEAEAMTGIEEDRGATVIFIRMPHALRARFDAYVEAQNAGREKGRRSMNAILCELVDRALKDATRDRKGVKP